MTMIPYGRQDVTTDDIDSVVRVLKSDFLTQGPMTPRFESDLCNFTGAKFSVAVSNCTSALHIACLALNLSRDDIVWTSPITFVASANCALYCGAFIDYVDIDPNTGLMSVRELRKKLQIAKKEGKLPKIVIPVHLAGQPCDMYEIHLLGKKYGFKIIEDAAHAIGARYKDTFIGSCKYSDITVFSFHPVKIITTGEGGASMTNDTNIANNMRLLSSHGIARNKDEARGLSKESWYYEPVCLGYNYRMSDIQSALGISQLIRLNHYIDKREKVAQWYGDMLDLDKVKPLIQKQDRSSSWHLFIIRVLGGEKNRKFLSDTLHNSGINTNLHYIPLYRHPYMKSNKYLPGSEEYYSHALTLPMFPGISYSDVKRISNIVNSSA